MIGLTAASVIVGDPKVVSGENGRCFEDGIETVLSRASVTGSNTCSGEPSGIGGAASKVAAKRAAPASA